MPKNVQPVLQGYSVCKLNDALADSKIAYMQTYSGSLSITHPNNLLPLFLLTE